MGADLIGIGYTYDHGTTIDENAVRRIIDTASTDTLRTIAVYNADTIDDSISDDDLREMLHQGFTTYLDINNGTRYSVTYDVPSPVSHTRLFVFAGSMTWGDAPFDGYDELALFLASLDTLGIPGDSIGWVGYGIATG